MAERVAYPTDYDTYAPTYAWTRWAVHWVVAPLAHIAETLTPGAAVLEIGCGTGNYLHALADSRGYLTFTGFDVSDAMLVEARARQSRATFVRGDAARAFPFAHARFGFAFAVDVIHHVENIQRFFTEAHRVLAPRGHLAIVTDSEGTLRRRSLTAFFPELLPIELARYPTVPRLDHEAARAGLRLVSHEQVDGRIPLDCEFLGKLEAKCSSAMRLIGDEQHAAGMNRVRAAAERGEMWLSCYDTLHYVRPGNGSAA